MERKYLGLQGSLEKANREGHRQAATRRKENLISNQLSYNFQLQNLSFVQHEVSQIIK